MLKSEHTSRVIKANPSKSLIKSLFPSKFSAFKKEESAVKTASLTVKSFSLSTNYVRLSAPDLDANR
jgi:hypothetical protein